jgi:predicted dinucleotide-utilizing enzyme
VTERAAPFAVGLIGAGRIGGAVAAFLRSDPRFRLAGLLTRRTPEAEREAFLAAPPPLVIDAAGPDCLRACGVPLLVRAEVWSVGASALAGEAFLDRMLAAERASGTRLRLFADWFGAADQCLPGRPARLRVAALDRRAAPLRYG